MQCQAKAGSDCKRQWLYEAVKAWPDFKRITLKPEPAGELFSKLRAGSAFLHKFLLFKIEVADHCHKDA